MYVLFYFIQLAVCGLSQAQVPRAWRCLRTLSNPYGDQAPAKVSEVQPVSLRQTLLFVLHLIKNVYLLPPIREAKIKRKENTNLWLGGTTAGILIHCWWGCKWRQWLWKTAWQFPPKLNIQIPYNPANPTLCLYLRERTPMPLRQRQLECPQQHNSQEPEDCENYPKAPREVWSVLTEDYYSAKRMG